MPAANMNSILQPSQLTCKHLLELDSHICSRRATCHSRSVDLIEDSTYKQSEFAACLFYAQSYEVN